ncbi:glycerophosphodiester phosphodiesterase family protein [Phytoactinopolyspora endophytica]|uniref:glycerophosphodiester phosphodiesterase family protein n=1 Tax=Phytoactinopolyspora endophytica TaxID=1642495 RepID=UPI00101DAAC2|nr:glycerophosphodiester phosphodiesterase family protein [Phytoactinopolyspora endophytica]
MARRLAIGLMAGITALAMPVTATAVNQPNLNQPVENRFDLQAHRGGLGLVVESTIPAFENALQLGVSTLELDIQITKDGEAVVTHDRRIHDTKCQDTEPAFADDPQYPYVGKYIKDLTLEQVLTLDCGTQTLPDYPGQRPSPGEKMPLLSEVFDLVHEYRAYGVMLNIETKVEAGAPHETAPREEFVQVVVEEIRDARMLNQVTIQSFDWGALMRVREVEPKLPIVALTNYNFLEIDEPGASDWLGGIDIDDFDGNPLLAIDSFGADAFSPVHGWGSAQNADYEPYVTKEMVDEAHELGIPVVPWTVDDEATMRKLIDDGVDGIITNYPDRLRDVMTEYDYKLPRAYRTPRGQA